MNKSTLPATPYTSWDLLEARIKRSKGQNIKLGAVTYSFSLPAIVTCPGRTEACSGVRPGRKRPDCYAAKLEALRTSVRLAYADNLRAAQDPAFPQQIARILQPLTGFFRLHPHGDLMSPEYATAILAAIRGAPGLVPFGFTRSWRVPAIRAAIVAAWGGVWPAWLLCSTDQDTGSLPADLVALGAREARMDTSVSVRRIRAGAEKAPKGWCDEQRDTARKCSDCGRCPLQRLVAGRMVPLPASAARRGVVFAGH